MSMLIAGLVIWVSVHLFPSAAPAARQRLVTKLGANEYQGLFALCIIVGLLLIIFGWRSTSPLYIYSPLEQLRYPAMTIAVLGFILMVAANFPTRIKRVIRHPQLTGVLFWAVAHLLLNGDSRSVIVFATMGCWCVLSMFTINRRDGAWVKPVAAGWGREIIMLVVGLILAVIAVRFHHYLSGVALT